jgi:hypothetical protein
MFEITGINLAGTVKNKGTFKSLSYPSDISSERWKEIFFDVDISPEVAFKEYLEYGRPVNARYDLCLMDHLLIRDELDLTLANIFIHDYLRLSSLDETLKNSGLNNARVLSAHGQDYCNGSGKEWYYQELDELIEPVQKWIDRYSNKNYGALIVSCCNPGNRTPKFRGTPVYYFKGLGCDGDGLNSASHVVFS